MGRPTGSKNKKQETTAKRIHNLTCATCGESKLARDFFISYHAIHANTKRIPYCKDCLEKMNLDDNGNISLDNVKKTLKLIDRPFLYDYWQISIEENPNSIFGIYMKNLAILQNRQLTWKDSVINPKEEHEDTIIINKLLPEIKEGKIDDKTIIKWGEGYKNQEYIAFERKYNLLINNYPQKTAMHTEALLNYIRYRVKEELSTAAGEVKEAKEWGALAKDAATAAKINPSQLSKADLSDGLSTFSELSAAVEKEVDIITILPKFKYRPNDALDFNILCYVNYIRYLDGLPECEYADLYAFYDQRKASYIKQYGDPYGIFADDPSEKNRDNIKSFLKEEDVGEV